MRAAGQRARRAPPARSRRREGGYNLVVVIVVLTVIATAASAALPLWSALIRRDKEEELIFRGWQYAEGIRLFQRRFQRLPTKLDELIKVKPRCLRQLWKDPITGDDFEPIYLNQPVAPPGSLRPQPEGTRFGADNPAASPIARFPRPGGPGTGNASGTASIASGGGAAGDSGDKPKVVATGPIIGVHSTSDKSSALTFFGHDHYNEWQFTVFLLGSGPRRNLGGSVGVGPSGASVLSVRWLGRPLPGQSGLNPMTNLPTNSAPPFKADTKLPN